MGTSQAIALADSASARLDKDMAYDAPNQLVECPRDERGESHGSDVARHVSVLQREPLSWTNWLVPVTVSVLGAAAVGVVVSAITVASRQPFGPTGVVLPTVPVTTTSAPPPAASSAAPIPPPAARGPSVLPPSNPPSIAPTTVEPSAPHPRRLRSRAPPIRRALVPSPAASARRPINRSRKRRPIFLALRVPITRVSTTAVAAGHRRLRVSQT